MTNKRQKRKYNPNCKYNPIVQSKRLDLVSKNVEMLEQAINAISESHDKHISLLGNFTRHDIKNSIQSMDSILSTNTAAEMTEEHLLSLKTNLVIIRKTIDNFSKLVPYSQDNEFTIDSLILAIEILNRATFQEKKIEFIKEYPKNSGNVVNLPFQALFQMINNLIINSIKALEGVKNPIIKLSAKIDNMLCLEIADNGACIEKSNMDRIFEYKFSTTGGSGIGLYHAKYLCDVFKGEIKLDTCKDKGFTKTFILRLPITNQ